MDKAVGKLTALASGFVKTINGSSIFITGQRSFHRLFVPPMAACLEG